jgi:hypothetical protein
MNTELQDIIASSSVRAFNAGYMAGKAAVLNAINFVKFEYNDLEVAAISDLEEELADREARNSVRQETLSEAKND